MAKSVHDIVNSPKFKSLVTTRWTVSFILTFLLFVVYYGYILLVGYNKEFLAEKIGVYTNYGIVLLGFGVGAIASSYIAGYYKNLANIKEVVDGVTKVVRIDLGMMQPAFIIASAAAVAGLILMALLKPPVRKAV